MDLAARGSKITLNGRGWVLADSVNARTSIGAERSGLTLNAHWINAVLTKMELLKEFRVEKMKSRRGWGIITTHAVAMYCPGHTLQD